MPTFEAKMKVSYEETWAVEADNEIDARRKIRELTVDNAVDGEMVDWEVLSIKQSGGA